LTMSARTILRNGNVCRGLRDAGKTRKKEQREREREREKNVREHDKIRKRWMSLEDNSPEGG